jgi:hypothetical protein
MQTVQYGTPIGPLCLQYYGRLYEFDSRDTPRQVNKCLGIVSDEIAGLETTTCRLIELHPHSKYHNRIVFKIRLFRSDLWLYLRDDNRMIWAKDDERPVLLYLDFMGRCILQGFWNSELQRGPVLIPRNG